MSGAENTGQDGQAAAPRVPAVRFGLWRLEATRVWRSRIWMLVVGAYLAFGVSGPIIAAYLPEILAELEGQLGTSTTSALDVGVDAAAGIGQFAGNASQLGVLCVIIAAVAALGYRSNTHMAQWLRTQASSTEILAPRYVATAALAGTALLTGTAAAAIGTAALIEAPPLWPLVWGSAAGILYLGFVVAVVGYATTRTGNLAAVFITAAILATFPVLALIGPLEPWLPSELVGAITDATAGAAATGYLRSAGVTVAATAALIAAAIRRDRRRDR